MLNNTIAHTNVALTNFSHQISNNAFVWEKLMPRVPVKRIADKYYIYGGERFKIKETMRARKAPSHGLVWTMSDTDFHCDAHAIHGALDQVDYDNTDSAVKLQQDTIEEVDAALQLGMENIVASMLTSTSNLTSYTNLDGNGTELGGVACDGPWDEHNNANTDPLALISYAKKQVKSNAQVQPNTIVMTSEIANHFIRNDTVVEYLKYQFGKQLVESGELPPYIKGLKVLIADAVYDSTKTNQTRTSFDDLWGTNCIVCYIAPKVGRKINTLGVTFDYKGRIVRQWHDNDGNFDKYELEEQGLDHVLVNASCAHLLTSVIS